MRAIRIALVLFACAPMVGAGSLQARGAARDMNAYPFDGSSRVVAIVAESADAAPLRDQRAELLKHVDAMDERDMVAFVILPHGDVEPVHGKAPTPAVAAAFLRRNPVDEGRFTVMLAGKDGGVKFRAEHPVRAQELFALIDTMPMRRQEMKR